MAVAFGAGILFFLETVIFMAILGYD
jgi:hypothetical protein